MRQILDFFALLAAAGGEQTSLIDWQLVEVTMRSPLRATAQAVPNLPGIAAEPIARREKIALASSIAAMVRSEPIPDWMDEPTRERARALFARNMNGIGRMAIQFEDDAPLTIIDQNRARIAVETIDSERRVYLPEEDRSRIEMGSVEGDVLLTGPYRGQPAIQLRERLSGADVWCIFTPEVAESIGPNHSWAETWRNRRVLVSGAINYGRDGLIRRVNVSSLRDIDPRPLSYGEVADPNFTGGLAASEYIESLWEEDVG